MSHANGSGDARSADAMVHLLCSKITGLKDDALSPYFKMALNTLSSNISHPTICDEFDVSEKIKKKLVRHNRQRDAAIFAELHRKLQSNDLLKKRWAVFYLLHRLSADKNSSKKTTYRGAFSQGLASHQMSTPHPNLQRGVTPASSDGTYTHLSAGSSGISSIHSSTFRSQDPSPISQSYAPGSAPPGYQRPRGGPGTAAKLADMLAKSRTQGASEFSIAVKEHYSRSQTSHMITTRTRHDPDNSEEELDRIILSEIVYIFQGIDGKFIKFEMTKEGFRLDPKVKISRSVRRQIAMLTECGWLYNKIRKYADSRSGERSLGLVGQSFCAAVHQEVNQYYKLLAVLESQLHQEEDAGVSLTATGLTLRQLSVWTSDPLVRLKTLAALVDICQGKKGGALASAIHSYLLHGDPAVRTLVHHTLTVVAEPLFTTILRWIYDGELEDTYQEFFVASDPTVRDIRIWHDKYGLRKSMIPSFLTMPQARKILLTGKSINFLRQLCKDRTSIRNRDIVKKTETNQVESIFSQDTDIFARMIDMVYKETSCHLLHVLHNKYKFMDHLKAMRRYLLLGQGDFIRHLMDLLHEELAKPAQSLFIHNLNGVLETAIRATNAQYDNPDILKRLDTILINPSPGDTGWDVFSLHYHMDGPISTILTSESINIYLRIFMFLWRAKRMEYVLAGIWRNQMYYARLLRTMPELSEVQHRCHIIASEMMHFVQQVQYYINFEVLECSWVELLTKVKEAKDLDHIIAAHQEFLDTVVNQSLLNKNSSAILTQLRTIFDLIIKFQEVQESIFQSAQEELTLRQLHEDKIKAKSDKGQWGVTDSGQAAEEERKLRFQASITQFLSKLNLLPKSYPDMVKQFLTMLAPLDDMRLRCLSLRLDFNENYCSKDPKLRLSMSGSRSHRLHP